MIDQVTGIEVHVLVKEWQSLIGAKIDKIFQPEKDEFLLRLHKTGIGKIILRIALPSLAYLTRYKNASDAHPGGFCMFLRKHLTNARIRKISQIGLERIVFFEMESKEKVYTMVVELFSKGNLILCEKNTIISALHHKKWKDREIMPKKEYSPPPKRESPFEVTEERLCHIINNSRSGSVVKSLAIDFGLGGKYSEEILALAKIDKDEKSLKDCTGLYKAIGELKSRDTQPVIVKDDGKVVDISPYKMIWHEGKEVISFPSFNEALDSIHSAMQKKILTDIFESSYSKKIEKVERIIESQSSQVKKFEKQIEQSKISADMIYENYAFISDLFKEIDNQLHKNRSWKDIKQALEKHEKIDKLDIKNKKITLIL